MSSATALRPAVPRGLAAVIVGPFSLIPYWLVALTARVALAKVFWSSAQTHLLSWQTTLYMFANSYKVPALLLLGLGTRFAALLLFGMTAVIEIFIYPQAWPTHIQWAAMMLVLMVQGGGALSLDAPIARWMQGRR